MKIIKRGKKTSQSFKVVKNNFFLPNTHQPEVGEVLEFIGQDGMSTALGLCQRGLIIPIDLPEKGEYIAVAAFSLPGKEQKYEAKVGDVVELKAADALPLMLRRYVIPQNKGQWSPFRLKGKSSPREKHFQDLAKSWSKEG